MLNIQDKHHLPFVTAVAMKALQNEVSADPFDTAQFKEWHWNFEFPDQSVVDGSVHMRLKSVERLGKMKGTVQNQIRLIVNDEEGSSYPLTGSLSHMLNSVVNVISLLAEN